MSRFCQVLFLELRLERTQISESNEPIQAIHTYVKDQIYPPIQRL